MKLKTKLSLENIKLQLDEIKTCWKMTMDMLLIKIKILKGHLGGIPEYLQLENHANMYDFEEALNTLKKLIIVITPKEKT